MLNKSVSYFFDRRDGEYAKFFTENGNYNLDYMNCEIAEKTKHLKIVCSPNYFYPKDMTIDKFHNLEILDIVDFQMCYIDYIIRDLKYLENLKILRLNNCDFLKNDVLPENLEILIIDDICNCSHWTEVLENLEKGIIKYENIIKLKNVPIFVKRIILNFNYYFVEILEKKELYDYFYVNFVKYLDCIKIPFGCDIILNGK